MTKPQWAALTDFCEENGCTTREVLKALKANGTIDPRTRLAELGEYTANNYEAMQQFLEDNLQ